LIYGAPTVTDDGELRWRRRGEKLDFVVADECGTIDRRLGRDLLATGARILVTGDAYQLPPVSGAPFFAGKPDFTLSEIHRQAVGSQPLRVATAVRKGGRVRAGKFDIDAVVEADVVICGLNKTRRQLNRMIRRARGVTAKDPIVVDRVVCLRNNHQTGVLNGTLWSIVDADRVGEYLLQLTLLDEVGQQLTVTAHDDGFHASKINLLDPDYADLDLFDFGYALTCHKAQGSEWQNVVVVDETRSPGFRYIAGSTPLPDFKKRWLYTATTRARASAIVMGAPR
jgi:exodeoxyribonuclease-5